MGYGLVHEPRPWMKPVAKVYDSNRRAGEFYYKVRLLAILIRLWLFVFWNICVLKPCSVHTTLVAANGWVHWLETEVWDRCGHRSIWKVIVLSYAETNQLLQRKQVHLPSALEVSNDDGGYLDEKKPEFVSFLAEYIAKNLYICRIIN